MGTKLSANPVNLAQKMRLKKIVRIQVIDKYSDDIIDEATIYQLIKNKEDISEVKITSLKRYPNIIFAFIFTNNGWAFIFNDTMSDTPVYSTNEARYTFNYS